jgi:hypothetical protein
MHLSENQKEVLGAVRALRQQNDGPVRTSQVRERTGKGSSHTSDLLGDLVEMGELVKLKRGIYDLPEFAENDRGRKLSSSADRDSHISEWPIEHGKTSPDETGSSGGLQVDDRLIRSYLGHVPSRDEAFFCRLEGDSMQPWLSEGDYVFALRTEKVSVPGRYVIWWGEDQAQICVRLSLIGEGPEAQRESGEETQGKLLKLKKQGPEETMKLRAVSPDVYETEEGDHVRMQIQGRVVWPPSTAEGVMETVTDQMGKVLEKAIGSRGP